MEAITKEVRNRFFIYGENLHVFSKSLKNKGNLTHLLVQLERYRDLIETTISSLRDSDKNVLCEDIQKYISRSQNILVKNFEDMGREILHEKTSLFLELNKLSDVVEKLSSEKGF